MKLHLMRSNKLIKGALLGAVVGGALVSFLVVVTSESRFIADALLVLGTGGVIGGALCGAIVSKYGKMGIAIGGIIGGIGGCSLAAIGTIGYAAIPWPSPQPYSGVTAQVDWGGGSWGPSRIQTYTVAVSLDTIQQYYEGQMNRYCEDTWKFSNFSDSECPLCREADCKIRRLWLEQYFTVRLHPISEMQTEATHIDSWQD